jgi:hypothetical protein
MLATTIGGRPRPIALCTTRLRDEPMGIRSQKSNIGILIAPDLSSLNLDGFGLPAQHTRRDRPGGWRHDDQRGGDRTLPAV